MRRKHFILSVLVIGFFTIVYFEKQFMKNLPPLDPIPKAPGIGIPMRPVLPPRVYTRPPKIVEESRTVEEEPIITKPLIEEQEPVDQNPVVGEISDEKANRRNQYISQIKKRFGQPEKCPAITPLRDYKVDPVYFLGAHGDVPCEIPCTGSGSDPDIGGSRSNKKCSKSYARTMENTGSYIGDENSINGNTHLNSDVVIQYFSWAEYDFMRPAVKKTGPAMLVAMISNCGPQYRLHYLQDLMDNGVSVRSYGSCKNNANKEELDNSYSDRLNTKMDIISKFKFTFSFENSETEDYVTEKLFGPLQAGSVPIYFGAPNGKIFAPDDHSVIFASDFASAKDLAKYLIYLDRNDTAYEEYLAWKTKGPTKEWIALMDLSIEHSSCRYCIRSADIDRSKVGEVVHSPYIDENLEELDNYEGKGAKLIKVRERGKFYLRWIHLEKNTVTHLQEKIYTKYNDKSKGNIYSIYRLWDRNKKPIQNDREVAELDNGHELEVIFENPGHLERHGYTKWWYTKNNIPLPK